MSIGYVNMSDLRAATRSVPPRTELLAPARRRLLPNPRSTLSLALSSRKDRYRKSLQKRVPHTVQAPERPGAGTGFAGRTLASRKAEKEGIPRTIIPVALHEFKHSLVNEKGGKEGTDKTGKYKVEYDREAMAWKKTTFPSLIPDSKKDILDLEAFVERRSVEIKSKSGSDNLQHMNELQVLYGQAFHEIVRQVSVTSKERGQLMSKLWRAYVSTFWSLFRLGFNPDVEDVRTEYRDRLRTTEEAQKKTLSEVHLAYMERVQNLVLEKGNQSDEITQLQRTVLTYQQEVEAYQRQMERMEVEVLSIRKRLQDEEDRNAELQDTLAIAKEHRETATALEKAGQVASRRASQRMLIRSRSQREAERRAKQSAAEREGVPGVGRDDSRMSSSADFTLKEFMTSRSNLLADEEPEKEAPVTASRPRLLSPATAGPASPYGSRSRPVLATKAKAAEPSPQLVYQRAQSSLGRSAQAMGDAGRGWR